MSENELIDLALEDAADRMAKAVEALERDLQTIRTGRAHPSLVEGMRIDYQGTTLALNQLATITAPEARMIIIQPWDKGGLATISKAIQQSDLGITPSNDGAIIRLVLPDLTEDRRRELVKQVGGKTEEARVAIRNIRRQAQDELRKLEKSKDISQDEERRAHEELEKLTQRQVEAAEGVGRAKEHDLLEV